MIMSNSERQDAEAWLEKEAKRAKPILEKQKKFTRNLILGGILATGIGIGGVNYCDSKISNGIAEVLYLAGLSTITAGALHYPSKSRYS